MPDGVCFIIISGFPLVTMAGARQTVWYSSQNWMPPVEQSAVGNAHRVKSTQLKQIPCFRLFMASSPTCDTGCSGK
jgi:hypothetical protein